MTLLERRGGGGLAYHLASNAIVTMYWDIVHKVSHPCSVEVLGWFSVLIDGKMQELLWNHHSR